MHAAREATGLASLFEPRSVVLVGATDASQWSVYTYANLRQHSPDVEVHLVHPRHEVVHGQRTLPSVAALESPVDLAYVMVPTGAALGVLGEVADAGISNVVMLTAGFAEAGPDGVALEAELVSLARRRGMTLLGPNGNGFVNVAAGVTPYGLPLIPPLDPGPVGIVLQSGGLASNVLAAAQAGGIGLSLLVSTGNEAVVSATDIIDHLVEDERTGVIAAFVESVRQPEQFAEVARRALVAGKPIVALKVGRSEAGARTALAHTGALAGDDRVVDAALRQLGVVRVDSLEEMLVTAGYLGHHPGVRGRRLAAVTPSGGACDLLADRASTEGLELPDLPAETEAELAELLPAFSNPRNPLDVTGYVVVDPSIAAGALEAVGASAAGRFDMVVYAATVPRAEPPDPAPIEARFDGIAAASARFGVPVVLMSSIHSDLSPYAARLLRDRGLHVLGGIELGTRAIGHGARYHERRDRWLSRERPADAPLVDPPPGSRGVWPEHLVRELLSAHGVPVAPAVLATNPAEAQQAAAAFAGSHPGPVVLKIASAQIAHKSELGGVRLGVDAKSAASVWDELVAAVTAARPDALIDGVLVTPQRSGGVELLVGVVTDPAWGKVLSIGLGGVWVEVLGDVSLRVLPVGAGDVADMLSELRGAPLLAGARGAVPADMGRVTEAILALARLAEGLGDALDSLEVNPLLVDGDTVEALDALAIWTEGKS